ncbi:MAG: hypothetical protein M0Q42_10085 [Xanthomonadales bacterium]|nr:hypothetical protein [Xanthomonadales bacterium]
MGSPTLYATTAATSAPLLLAALMLAPAAPAMAVSLQPLLACQDSQALSADPAQIAAAAADLGFTCQHRDSPRRHSLHCTGGNTQVLGSRVQEFTLSQTRDGGATLSVALAGRPADVQARLAQSQTDPAQEFPGSREVGLREDGIAELNCQRSGAHGSTGAIAGTLDFRGVQPVPAMRVCAAPVSTPETPICMQTRRGDRHYRLEDLPAGSYYLTAFALENNPNRLFAVHAQPLRDCAPGDSACTPARLQKIEVHPGERHDNIDPDTLLPDLPPPLRRPAGGQ